ncbi:MAG: polysaccharide biosynthesis tyrosine autokinase [Lentisphaerae bacterium]|nr:polysaccharide biosynthesis tyrosine autokinase [Lentisphaerota bacterium]
MELKRFLEIINRRKWFVLSAFFLVAGTAWVGSVFLPDFYEATAKFTVRSGGAEESLLSNIGLNNAGARARTEEDIPNRAAMAMTAPILEAVARKLQLRDGEGNFWTPARLAQLALLSGRTSFKVERVVNTEVLRIKARSRDPDEAAMMANTLAEIYIEQNRQEKKEEFRLAKEFVAGNIDTVKKEFLQILTEIKDFKIAENVVDLTLETQRAIERMSDLLMMKENAVVSLAQSKAQLTATRAPLTNRAELGVSTLAISENRQIELLKKNLGEAEVQLAGVLVEKRSDHPDAIALNGKIENLRRQLETELQTFVVGQEAQLKNLDEETSRLLAEQLTQFPRKAIMDSQLQLRYSSTRDLYESLLDHLNQVGIAEVMTLSDIKLIEPANLPRIDDPKGPRRGLIRFLGMFLGVVFGLSLGFLVNYLDDTIRTPEEVQQAGLSLIGTIPKFRHQPVSLIHDLDPSNPVCEAYRMVRRSVRLAGVDKPVRSLVVTSPMAGEGKTTTAANLAISIVREGRKVLLMDTDLRKPSLHKKFGLSNEKGLTDVLTENLDLAAAIQSTGIDGLSVLPSGPVPPDPGHLIESDKLKQLLQTLCARHDTVILDSPPVLACEDALVLAGIADATISVLESGRETRRALAIECEHFNREGMKLLGVVLNKFNPTGFDYRAYRYYHSYDPTDRADGEKGKTK